MSPPISTMTEQTEAEIGEALDRLGATAAIQSNCMFQLALMVARIAVEPCAESFKDEAAQALMDLIRAKPRSNVVRLFGAPRTGEIPAERPTVVQLATR